MVYPDTFIGYAGTSKDKWHDLELIEYKPRPFEENDVDIKIEYCGICGSDLHVLKSGWKNTAYPVVAGHEISGEVVRVGSKVEGLKVGDKAGVGPVSWACLECEACRTNNEQCCTKALQTYGDIFPNGYKGYGGYANYSRTHQRFVTPIPTKMDLAIAAPMLCAGLTMFTPLQFNHASPTKRVGIVGIGGLGHFGLMFSHAMGCQVTAISHSRRKEQDAYKMGAHKFIATSEEGWAEKNQREFDLIISTNADIHMPLNDYISLLSVNGTFVLVALPDGDLPKINNFTLFKSNAGIRASNTGSKPGAIKMLNFALDNNIKSWIQIRPLSDVRQALVDMDNGKAKYRYVLKADLDSPKLYGTLPYYDNTKA